MKKFYTLATCAVATLCAAASQPMFEATPAQAALPNRTIMLGDGQSLQFTEMQGIDLSALNKVQFIGEKPSTKAVTPSGSWSSLGQGAYYDVTGSIFCDADENYLIPPTEWKVEMYQDSENANIYGMRNPFAYSESNYAQLGIVAPDAAADEIWAFDVTDPKKVEISLFVPYLYVPGVGYITPMGTPTLLTMTGQTAEITDDMYATYTTGRVNIPAGGMSIIIWDDNFENATGAYIINKASYIKMPGYVDYSADVKVQCHNADYGIARFSFSDNTARRFIGVVIGKYPASAENLAAIANDPVKFGGMETTTLAGLSFGTKITPPTKNRQVISVFAVGTDADKNVVSGAVDYYYADDTYEWNSIGSHLYQDGIIYPYYVDQQLNTYEVEIEERADLPGYYRMVNPFADTKKFPLNVHYDAFDDAHNAKHYVYINATDPNKVYIEQSLCGFEYDCGPLVVWSLAGNKLENGSTPADADYGKLTKSGLNKIISMPASKIAVSEPGYQDGAWAWTNKSGTFSLRISSNSGVTDLQAADANTPAEYFNLQGVRIANPQPGQLVIERRAGTTTKVRF